MERRPHRWNDGGSHQPRRGPLGTISEQQAADYDALGYFVMPAVFGPEQLADLDRAIAPGEQLIRGLLE